MAAYARGEAVAAAAAWPARRIAREMALARYIAVPEAGNNASILMSYKSEIIITALRHKRPGSLLSRLRSAYLSSNPDVAHIKRARIIAYSLIFLQVNSSRRRHGVLVL